MSGMAEGVDATLGEGEVDRFGEIEWSCRFVPKVSSQLIDLHVIASSGGIERSQRPNWASSHNDDFLALLIIHII